MRTPRLTVALAAALLSLAAPASLLADLDLEGGSSLSLGDDSTSDGGPKPCGTGTKIECGSMTYYKCLSWKLQPSAGPTGASYTYFCEQSVTVVTKMYKD